MKNVDIRQLELLCELIKAQSLTEAAQNLHMTPSGASQSLTRLRQVLGDELCLREGSGYQMTPYGAYAIESFRQIVELWNDAHSSAWQFDPQGCTEHIVISCYEALAETDLADFYRETMTAAPRMRLDIYSPTNGPQDILELRTGAVDVVCGYQQPPPEARDLHVSIIRHIGLTHCVLSVEHPRIRDTLTLEQYLAERHLRFAYVLRQNALPSPVDLLLAEQGHPARQTCVVSSWGLCRDMLAKTDRILTVDGLQAQQLCRSSPQIKSIPLPEELSGVVIPIYMVWPHRTHNNKAHRWLRAQLKSYLESAAQAAGDASPVPATPG